MKNPVKLNQKKIPLDPLTILEQLKPDSQEDTSALLALHTSYLNFHQQHSALNDKLKATSRKIGEAKKQNIPVDNLKSQACKLSQKIKPLTAQLNKLKKEIQTEFIRLSQHDKTLLNEADVSKKEIKRNDNRYKLTEIPAQDVTINIIDTNTATNKNATIYQRWNLYVINHPAATIHHTIDWQGILHHTYGHKCYYFYASTADETIVGILPVIRITSRLFGDLMVSMPYFQRGGAIADNAEIETLLIKSANKKAHELRVKTVEYRDEIYRNAMPAQQHKVNMILPLPRTTELLWEEFSAKLRAQIKRPKREKPIKRIGKGELLDDFYKVYTRNMRDLGSPAHSKSLIKSILNNFPENSWLVVIYHNKHAVATALLLGYKDTMEIPLASTIRNANRYSMNMFLYWEVLKFTIKNKYEYFDFGRSTLDSGTYHFKHQWGARPKQLFWHYWLPENAEPPQLNPSNPKFFLAINVWKRLPIFITKLIGPFIVKNLP